MSGKIPDINYPDWGAMSGEIPGADVNVSLKELIENTSQTALAAIGEGVIGSADWIRRNKGYIKGGLVVAGWAGLTAMAKGSPQPSENPQNAVEFIIKNPLGVILGCGALGGAYGFVYSSLSMLDKYKEQEEMLKGDYGQTAQEVQAAGVKKMMEDMEKQATDPKTGQIDSTKLSALKLKNPQIFEKDPLKRMRDYTFTSMGNAIMRTTVNEIFEGLDVGVKLALVPAYLNSEMQVTFAKLREVDQSGASFQQLAEIFLNNSSQAIAVLILGGAALVQDVKTSIEQRVVNILPSDSRGGQK